MKTTKRIVFITIIFMIILLPFTKAMAVDINTNDYNPDNISTKSKAALLVDAKTGKILYSKNAFTPMYPASTTKIMTAILTMENCNLNDIATVSHNAVFSIPIGYSHANLVEGEQLTVEQLLNVLLIPSANDAAVVLAEHIAGSVENFATLMNKKAKQLGCLNTNFVNPNGIHNENHYSTAYDLSLIGRYAMKFDEIMKIAKVSQYTLPKTNKYNKEDRIFNATNGLINPNDGDYYEFATGLKTGYTDKAGSCIVATAQKGDVQLMAVILGSDSVDDRHDDCVNLFNYGFNNYSYKNIITSGKLIDTVAVEGATKETKNLNIVTKDNINVLIKNSVDIDRIEKTVDIKDNLTAPIAKDAVLGTITYTIDGQKYSTELVAEYSVIESNFEVFLFRALLIILILLIFIIIIGKLNKTGKRGKSNRASSYKKSKKSSKSKKRSNPKKGGHYKYTQIHEYL